jgi:hypothetical protein
MGPGFIANVDSVDAAYTMVAHLISRKGRNATWGMMREDAVTCLWPSFCVASSPNLQFIIAKDDGLPEDEEFIEMPQEWLDVIIDTVSIDIIFNPTTKKGISILDTHETAEAIRKRKGF